MSAPYPPVTKYLPFVDKLRFPSALADPDKVKAHELPAVNGGIVVENLPGEGVPSISR